MTHLSFKSIYSSCYSGTPDTMISKPCLAPVNFDLEIIVTCDGSESYFGTCLSQIGLDGVERPCAYASKLLSEKESKQSPGIRERAALIYSLRH